MRANPDLDSTIKHRLSHSGCTAQGALSLTRHTGDREGLRCLHTPEVLAAQGLQVLSQGAVQACLCAFPCRLDKGGEEPPEQAEQEGVPDQL